MSQYTQRFAEVFLIHGGQIDCKTVKHVLEGKVAVAQWADGLTPELRRVLPLLQAKWRNSALGDLADSLAGYERDSNVKLHISAVSQTAAQKPSSQTPQTLYRVSIL